MNGTHHKGLRVILLLTILFVNLGLDHAQMVYAAAPTNDNFANAKLINSITYTDLNVNTAEATPRYNPVTKALVAPGDNADPDNVGPCEDNFYFNIASNTVWYTYTPQVTESISVDTNGSDYDTFVAVWTGSPPNLNLVGCNDDNYLGDSELSFTANAGTAYHIQVGEFNGYYDPNPANEDLGGNSGGTLQFHAFITNVEVTIGGDVKGRYYMESGDSTVESYPGVNGGPVVIKSINGEKIIASLLQYRRPAYTGGWTGITQTMAVTNTQISNKYVFPHYDYTDPTRYNSLQLANYDTIDTNIIVEIGGVQRGKFPIAVGSSQNVTFSGVIGGPVVVYSENDADIIVSLYELKKPITSSKWTGQSQMMGLPWAQLSDTYIIPRYNYTLQDVVPYVIFAAP